MKITLVEPNVYAVSKPAGITPLQALDALRAERPELAHTPLTYAGRLDPMAEGLLLVLAGDAVYRKEEFLKLDKTYQATILLGVETDSWDLLGLPRDIRVPGAVPKSRLEQSLQAFIGQTTLPLPSYSSPLYNGKPLYWWAQRGLVDASGTPNRTSTIYSLTFYDFGTVRATELLTYLRATVTSIQGNFRQEKTVAAWHQALENIDSIPSASFTVRCESGTYIRSLSYVFGRKLGIPSCLYKLTRTSIGPYGVKGRN